MGQVLFFVMLYMALSNTQRELGKRCTYLQRFILDIEHMHFCKKKNADYGGTPLFYRKSLGEKEITEKGLPLIMNQIHIVVFD